MGATGNAARYVLIVDNQAIQAAQLERQLRYLGLTVRVAKTGAGALKRLEEHTPDLVLLEVNLSDMDGLEVVDFMRNDPKSYRVPVIAMSALPHNRDRCLQSGCNEFIQKPFRVIELAIRLRKSLPPRVSP
jgi:CheY-like chemotaxis protein